ncbi:hypothetical protein AZSI13_06620 [Azospira sp. I13]|nr:hypothetical protein AZSI13_06620 [Azospira sp. I13]
MADRRILIENGYKSLDRHDRVIYLGTFSKRPFPTLRLACALVPEWLVEPFASAISLAMHHAPILPQAVLAAFIGEGHFARHLRQMRRIYGERAACFQHKRRPTKRPADDTVHPSRPQRHRPPTPGQQRPGGGRCPPCLGRGSPSHLLLPHRPAGTTGAGAGIFHMHIPAATRRRSGAA